jgi:hypothetical protein
MNKKIKKIKKIKMAKKRKKNGEVSITRSFSMKVSLRGLTPSSDYEMADIFTSQTVKAKQSEATKTSDAVYAWVKAQTVRGVNDIRAEIIKKKTELTRSKEIKEGLKTDAAEDGGQ